MEENSIMLLKKNIIKIEKINKENKNIIKFWEGVELELFSINKITHKYSNTKVPLYRFFFNNNNCSNFIDYEENIITRNNHYNVSYKCINCNSIHKVSLNNILRKINRNINNCKICKEYEELKRNNHSNYMLNYHSNKNDNSKNIIIKQISLLDKLNNDKIKFHEYDSDFKDNYFKRNMDNY
jgi:transcription elongation factor Elf1